MKELNGFYRGVIESNNDPEKMGRCRIRVFGIHTPQKEKVNGEKGGVSTDELPWATPANPITEGSVSGFGSWSIPLQGSHVFVFFENGHPNQPVYFASAPGKPTQESDPTMGFNDPEGVYPKKDQLDEPDVNRLVRGVSEDTIVETKDDNLDTDVNIAGGGTWSEPKSTFNPTYPENLVIATHGGHVIELDNTPNNERIHIYHPTNSYVEIDPEGNMVIRNNKDRYEVVIGGRNIHIKNDSNETVDQNRTVKVGAEQTEDIGSNADRTIGGNLTDDVSGNETKTIGGALNITVTGECNLTADIVNIDGNSGGGTLDGVVTGECLCAFTGKPHIQKSSNVKGTL